MNFVDPDLLNIVAIRKNIDHRGEIWMLKKLLLILFI